MRKRNELIWFLPLCFVFLSLIMIKFCTPRINEKYIIEAIKRENIELFVDTKGTVQAKDLINIGLDIDMGVDNIYFKQGDKVKKVDVIIRFSDYQNQDLINQLNIRNAELAVKKSQLRYLRVQYKQGMQVMDQIQKLSGEIASLETDVKKMFEDSKLVQRVIFSPADGYIVKINVVKGGTTNISTPVLILVRDDNLKIVTEPIETKKLEYVNIGNSAQVKSLNLTQNDKEKKADNSDNFKTFSAVLYKINDTNVENLKTLELLTNSFKDIILNEPLNIRIFYQKKENILTVPLKAVVKRKINNIIKTYIYFIDKDNKVTEKEVYTGINNGEKVEIYGIGIDKGQEIIVKRRSLEDEEKIKKIRS